MAVERRKDNKNRVLKEGEYQRTSGTYEFKWRDKRGNRHSISAVTLEELRTKELDVLRDVLDGVRGDKKTLTINDLYYSWIQLKRGLKDNTFSNYKYMYIQFVEPDFGKSKLTDLKRSDVRGFYNYLAEERHVKVNTIDNIHTVLHQVLELGVEDDYLRYNPSDNALKELKKARNFETEKRRALTISEQELFESFLSKQGQYHRWYPIFVIMMWTGMRVGDDDDKIRLNQRKPSKYKGLSRFGPEKNLQRINKFMKERPTFYKKLIQMKENFRFYLRCFYCITKVVILQFNSEKQDRISS